MLDRVEIMVKAGDGGDGAVSFRREKFVPLGGPDGGDGGDGGDVVIMADSNVSSLHVFKPERLYRAVNGGNGQSKKKHGRRGADLVLKVPLGTAVLTKEPVLGEVLIADLAQPGQRQVAASGSQGGWGNTHFVSANNQAPRLAQKGAAGEERPIILELRLLADVGIIGYPNVGKSTLLAAVSAAKPKVASYPFTTLEPVLGVVESGEQRFVLAEIPGLVDGAHLGRGLGHDFLRHGRRTKVLLHLLDGASPSPLEDMARVNTELVLFDPALAQKPQLVVINKIDLPEVRARLAELKNTFGSAGMSPLFVSAVSGEGLSELVAELVKMLAQVMAGAETGKRTSQTVFRPQPRGTGVSVHKEGDTLVVVAPELERIAARADMTNPEVRGQFRQQLTKLGVNKALEKAGVVPGAKVRCGDFEWEW